MGYKIKEMREKMQMTQEQLAKKSGISRVTISQLECGVERGTTSTTLLRLARALGTTVDQLFFDESVN